MVDDASASQIDIISPVIPVNNSSLNQTNITNSSDPNSTYNNMSNNTTADPIISGTVYSCDSNNTMQGVNITVYNLNDQQLAQTQTGTDGCYNASFLSAETTFKVKASYPGHVSPIEIVNVTRNLDPYDLNLYGFASFHLGTNAYVDAVNGNDSWDGSSVTRGSGLIGPKKTITAGITVVDVNGTVIVANGTYTENISINKKLTVTNATGANVTVKASAINSPVFTINSAGSGASIIGLIITGATSSRGIYLNSANNTTIYGNTFSSNYAAIRSDTGSLNNISVNNISSSNSNGVDLYSSANNNTVSGNNISSSSYGIYISSSMYNVISGNKLSNISGSGSSETIYLNSANNNTIIGNNLTKNNDGIYLSSANNNTISGNNIINTTGYYGINLASSSKNNTISGNNLTNNYYGLSLNGSGNILTGNIIQNSTKYNFGILGTTVTDYIESID
ncbi:MAG: NosD domain-containing protein, partial [Methanobacterium sp.]